MHFVFLASLFACDTPEKADDVDTSESPTTTTTTGGELTRDEVCDHLRLAFDSCESPSITALDGCDGDFWDCTQHDLQVLVNLGDCVLANCQNTRCDDHLNELSDECLGVDNSDSGVP